MAKPLTKAGCGPGPGTVFGLRVQVTPPSVLFETPQLGGPLVVGAQPATPYMVVGVSGSRTSSGPTNGPNRTPGVPLGEPSGVQFWPRSLLTYRRSDSAN